MKDKKRHKNNNKGGKSWVQWERTVQKRDVRRYEHRYRGVPDQGANSLSRFFKSDHKQRGHRLRSTGCTRAAESNRSHSRGSVGHIYIYIDISPQRRRKERVRWRAAVRAPIYNIYAHFYMYIYIYICRRIYGVGFRSAYFVDPEAFCFRHRGGE